MGSDASLVPGSFRRRGTLPGVDTGAIMPAGGKDPEAELKGVRWVVSSSHSRKRTIPGMQRLLALLRLGQQDAPPADARSPSWARRLKTREEVPAGYQDYLTTLRAAEHQGFPYSVLTPTFEGIGRWKECEKLICLHAGALHVAEVRDDGLAAISYPLGGCCVVERGKILLYSWITIHGPTNDGAMRSTTLKFNSVTEHFMAPFVSALRARPNTAGPAGAESMRGQFDFLKKSHYKFFSYGRSSVRPGDRLLRVLLQPRLRACRFRLFGYSISRLISPAHLTILTDTEIIMIRDDESQSWINDQAPGAIWNYIPRGLVDGAAIDSSTSECLRMTLHTAVGRAHQAVFSAAAMPILEEVRGELQI